MKYFSKNLSLNLAIASVFMMECTSGFTRAQAQEPTIELTARERAALNKNQNKVPEIGTFNEGVAYQNQGNFKKAVEIWLPLAQNGHARAQFNLGYMYNQAIYFNTDISKCIEWWSKSGEQGFIHAQAGLGLLYYLGQGTFEKDFTKAAYWNQKAADNGDAKAQLYIGVQYGMGNGVSKDIQKAQKYLQMSVNQGHGEAIPYLQSVDAEIKTGEGSPAYLKGMDAYIAGQYKQARKILEPLAKNGDMKSQFAMSEFYRLGQGVKTSASKSFKWLQKSAAQNHPKAQSNLGQAYQKGLGVKQSNETALEWFKKSADQDEAAGQSNLGFMYANGFAVERDYEKAVFWFEKSLEQGFVGAQFGLGTLAEQGTGLPQSDEVAAKLYEMAVAQNFAPAMISLGQMYDEGRGVDQDSDRTYVLYKQAMDAGSALGATYLGTLYLSGRGVSQNDKTAAKWIEKGADGGDLWAMYMYALLHKSGKGVRKNIDIYHSWLKKAAYAGFTSAQIDLAIDYENGTGGARGNSFERDFWIEHASKQGNAEAQYWRANFYAQTGKFENAKIWYEKALAQNYTLAQGKLQNLANGSTQEKYRIDRRKAIDERWERHKAQWWGPDAFGFQTIANNRRKACRANPGNNANGYRASGGAWRCP